MYLNCMKCLSHLEYSEVLFEGVQTKTFGVRSYARATISSHFAVSFVSKINFGANRHRGPHKPAMSFSCCYCYVSFASRCRSHFRAQKPLVFPYDGYGKALFIC